MRDVSFSLQPPCFYLSHLEGERVPSCFGAAVIIKRGSVEVYACVHVSVCLCGLSAVSQL